jgi:hypothetical protein
MQFTKHQVCHSPMNLLNKGVVKMKIISGEDFLKTLDESIEIEEALLEEEN